MVQIMTTEHGLDFETVHMTLAENDLPFAEVSARAKQTAREINKDAMMLSWYDRRRGEGYPNYECSSDRPFWEMFAESRGCNLEIVVNDGAYIFYYLKL